MKKLLSVISILLLILVSGSVSSLATELNSDNEAESGTVQIGSTNSNKSSSNTNKANTSKVNAAKNNVEENAVGATNTNKNKTNTNTNKANTSSYNSTNSSSNSSKLPYAGTSTTSVVLIAIAFIGSAIYAYKKVSDYNL